MQSYNVIFKDGTRQGWIQELLVVGTQLNGATVQGRAPR